MPAVVRNKPSKHSQTPYARKQKQQLKQSDDEVILSKAGASGLIDVAAKGLFRLVSWAFASSDDLSQKVGASASKVMHRERPQRSLTSQLEDGTLNGAATRSQSMLAPDLVPHYLGKTPKIVKARRDAFPHAQEQPPTFQIPKFDSSQFKIPVLPTPEGEKISHDFGAAPPKDLKDPPRGRSMKSLVMNFDTQVRHDDEVIVWLSSQKLSPEDLVSLKSLDDARVDDYDKLRRIMNDSAFFRRRGLFPPVKIDNYRSAKEPKEEGVGRQPGNKQTTNKATRRAASHGSAISIDKTGSDRSSTTIRGQRIDSRNWQTNSSSGILAAWRDICERQESSTRTDSLKFDAAHRRVSRAASEMSIQQEPTLWHEGVSFTDAQSGGPVTLGAVQEVDTNAIEAGEKYWAPIRSFPMPSGPKSESDVDMKSIASTSQRSVHHRRRHSRQPSQTRRQRQQQTQQQPSRSSRRSRRDARNDSTNSSQQSTPRHQTRTSRSVSHHRNTSDSEKIPPKVKMVEAQVQTTDELMSFLKDDSEQVDQQTPTISKERRKRPGCFSALDEDMEDLFGPYSDLPLKKARLDDDETDLMRPRVALLREDEQVKQLRAQKAAERVAMPPPQPSPQVRHVASDTTNAQPGQSAPVEQPAQARPVEISHNMGSEPSAPKAPSAFSFTPVSQSSAKEGDLANSNVPKMGTTVSQNAPPPFSYNIPTLSTTSSLANKQASPEGSASMPKFSFGSATGTKNGLASTSEPFSFLGNTTSRKDASKDSDKAVALPDITNRSSSPNNDRKQTFDFGKSAGFGEAGKLDKPSIGFGTTTSSQDTKAREPSSTLSLSQGEISEAQAPGPMFGASKSLSDGGNTSSEIQNGSAVVPDQTRAAATKDFTFGFSNASGTKEPAAKPAMPNFTFGSTNSADPKTAASAPTAFIFGSTNSADPKTTASAPTAFSFGSTSTANVNTAVSAPTAFSLNSKADDNTVANPAAQVNFDQGTKNGEIGATSLFGNGPLFSSAHPPGDATVPGLKSDSTLAPIFGNTKKDLPKQGTGFSFSPAQDKAGSSSTAFGSIGGQTQSGIGGTSGTAPAAPFGSPVPTVGSTSMFGSGVAAPVPAGKAVSNFSFGQTAMPESKPAFGFGASSSSAQSQQPIGMSDSAPPTAVFGAQPSQSQFGQAPQSTTAFGSANGNGNNKSGFSFGLSNAAQQPAAGYNFNTGDVTQQPVVNLGFGSNNSAQTPSSNFAFGQAGTSNTTNPTSTGPPSFGQNPQPTFHFGAASNTQAVQPFAFGQTAPSSGFASPAALSPSIQTATAPGSPNPFSFNAAGTAAGSTGPRKILPARSRRGRR